MVCLGIVGVWDSNQYQVFQTFPYTVIVELLVGSYDYVIHNEFRNRNDIVILLNQTCLIPIDRGLSVVMGNG